MIQRRMISPCFVEDALACVRAKGVDPAPLLAAAGLPDKVTELVSADQYGTLWLSIAKAIDDEFFGLGKQPMRAGSFVLLGHAVLSATSLEQALRRALRFLNIVLAKPSGRLEVQNRLAHIVLEDDGPARSAFAYRTYWLIVHGISCWLVGRRIPLRRVDFRCAAPAHEGDYRLFFGAPVWFDQPRSMLAFDASFLSLPVMRNERALKEFLRRAPANILVRYRHDAGLVVKVKAHLRAIPASAWPSFEELARHLRMPASSLRRRLAAEGQTYMDIKDELRRRMAERLLNEDERSVGEIASELGFSEPSAFHRAFKKWTEHSPGAFRRRAHEGPG